MLNLLENFILFIFSPASILLLMIFAYVWGEEKKYGLLLLYVIFGLFINAMLKLKFAVPLAKIVGKPHWYAFPSGHTQFIATFLCCLISIHKKKSLLLPYFFLTILIFIYLMLIVDRGYHNWYDIGGGIISGVILGLFFYFLQNKITSIFHYLYFATVIIISEITILLLAPTLPCEDLYCKYNWLWNSWGFSLGILIFSVLSLKNKKSYQSGFDTIKTFMINKGTLVFYWVNILLFVICIGIKLICLYIGKLTIIQSSLLYFIQAMIIAFMGYKIKNVILTKIS